MSPFVCCRSRASFAGLALLTACALALIALPPRQTIRADSAYKGVEAEHGMVVSVSAPGSEVGLEILKKGGNAVDAAVATAFALAVTYPQAGNIGGGGFMVVYPGGKAEPVVFDYRETAPAAATKTLFSKNDSWYGHKVVGVPGTVRGLALAHHRFGKLPWKDVLAPAIHLAENGFILGESLANSLNAIVCSAVDFPELRRVYGKRGGEKEWEDGDLLI